MTANKTINPTGNSPCRFYAEVVAPAGYLHRYLPKSPNTT